jgi:FixJ family two-component response regulator
MTKRVLVIDDEENIRQMIRFTLEAAGYEVDEAQEGLEAFAILGGDKDWDVILLDQRLPLMEGTEVLRRLKVLAPNSRVVMMTAYASIELAVEAMQIGATDFLRKPMTPEVVRNAVSAAMLGHSNYVSKDDAEASRRTVTMNGFAVRTASPGTIPGEYHFVVREPRGTEQQVVVEISPQAFEEVERIKHGVPLDSDFWLGQAEAFLADFIWNDGHVPAGGQLVLKGADRDTLEKLARKAKTDE